MAQRLSEMSDLVGTVLDAIPAFIFLVDYDVRIIGYNLAASGMLVQDPEMIIRRRAGEILHCLHATEAPGGCGRAKACQDCLIRNSVNEALRGHRVVRKKVKMELIGEGRLVPIYLLVTTSPFTHGDKSWSLLILEDISELMELKNIIPICANCKRIRNDQDYWQGVENYFKEHLDMDFSHGICSDCAKKLYPDYL